MKKFIIPVIALLAVGCNTDTATESHNELIEISIEDLNAHRGDPCDCVNEKLEVIDAIQAGIDAGKHTTTDGLNEAINETIDGCMASVNHKEADLAWANSLKGCEAFGLMVQGMASIHTTLLNMKQSTEQEFIQDFEGASGVLDKLQESAY